MSSPIFYSWVPNVVGALSFKKIGESDKNKTGFYRRNLNTLFVCAYARRNSSDSVFRVLASALDPFSDQSSVHQYFVVACGVVDIPSDGKSLGRISEIKGKVFIQINGGRPWFKSGRAARSFRMQTLGSMAERYEQFDGLGVKFEDLLAQTYSDVRRQSLICVDFILRRSGKIELRPDLSFGLLSLPENQNDSAVHAATMQTFAFIRDITHTHKHHAPRTDTIVGLHNGGWAGPWHLTIKDSLRRKLVMLHSNTSYRAQADAIGVAAYLESFNQLFSDPLGEEEFPDGRSGSDALVKSIAAKRDKHQIFQNTFFQIAAYLLGLFAVFRFVWDLERQVMADGGKNLVYGGLVLIGVVLILPILRRHQSYALPRAVVGAPELLYNLFAWVLLPLCFFTSVAVFVWRVLG